MSTAPILFETFEPGKVMGTVTEIVTPEQLAAWAALYPWDAATDVVPAGFATALMMRAYLRIVTPRPPGNLHVRQRLTLSGAMTAGREVAVSLSCRSKELRGARRQVELGVSGYTDGTTVFEGIITLYWAA